MNRTELIDYISEKAELTKALAARALDAFQEGITLSLQKGDPVVLVNFCTLTVKQRAAREGRNPSTGEKIKIKAARVVGFKAGKALKDALKDKDTETA
jgi:DNA-binding protein HU-beta